MIHASINIRNPLWRDSMNDGFRNYFSREPLISENKFISLDITRHWYHLFRLVINLAWTGEDHAGPGFELGLLGYEISLYLRDKRHWNHEEDRWYESGEDIGGWGVDQ